MQNTAQAAENTYIPKSSPQFQIGSSAVSVQVGTGRILDMVQNKTYSQAGGSKTATGVNYNANLALGDSQGFQPGSTYKLFTLLDWLETGHTLNTMVNGTGRTIPAGDFTACGKTYSGNAWPVHNDSSIYNGNTSVLRATAYSINGAFASMAQQLDLCDIQNLAFKMGVYPADGETQPAMYLPFVIGGSYGVSPVSMAAAYATVANEGVSCSPIAIDSVIKPDGTHLAVPSADCHRVIPKQVAIAAEYALRTVFQYGTAAGDNTADGVYELARPAPPTTPSRPGPTEPRPKRPRRCGSGTTAHSSRCSTSTSNPARPGGARSPPSSGTACTRTSSPPWISSTAERRPGPHPNSSTSAPLRRRYRRRQLPPRTPLPAVRRGVHPPPAPAPGRLRRPLRMPTPTPTGSAG